MVKKLTSPGVQVIEVNSSQYAPTIAGAIPGIVGFASKGPIASTANSETATLITSPEQLVQTFGRPDQVSGGQGLLAALEVMENTDRLYFVRCASSTATAATVNVDMGTCPAVYVSGGPTTSLTATVSSVKDSAGTELLSQSIALNSTQDGTTEFSTRVAEDFNKLVVDGDAVKFIPVGLSGGYFVGSYAGSAASLSISATSSALRIIEPISGTKAAAAADVTASGSLFTNGDYQVSSIWAGAGYNYTTTEYQGKTRVTGNSIEVESQNGDAIKFVINNDGAAAEVFSMSFTPSSSTWCEKVINETYDKFNPDGSDYIIGDLNVTGSVDVTHDNWYDSFAPFAGLSASYKGSTAAVVSGGAQFMKFLAGTYNLASGSNGDQGSSTTIPTSVLIGTAATKDGIYALDDETLGITLAAVPGYTDQTVQNALITLAETTGDFVAYVSPPVGLATEQEAIDWHNGKANGRTAAINSTYASIMWPWTQIYDVFSKTAVWLDPVTDGMAVKCLTDAVADSWTAPAGPRRGRRTKPTAVEVSLNLGARNALYSGGNVINPIVNFNPQGITIWGQRTATRTASALDRLNVRYLMILIRRSFLASTRDFVFEPNDPITWSDVKNVVDSILRDIQRRRGIVDFEVIVDQTVNTPLRQDRNELWAKVLIKPTKTAEIINLEVNLTNSSADFSSNATQ